MAQNSPVHGEQWGDSHPGPPPGVPGLPPLNVPAQVPSVPVDVPTPLAPTPLDVPTLSVPGAPPAGPAVAPEDAGPTAPLPPVTDEDRQVYGRLLDSAHERGLLGPYDYEVRLRELSDATSIEEMKAIVTEMPIFVQPPAVGTSRRTGSLLSSSRASSRARSRPEMTAEGTPGSLGLSGTSRGRGRSGSNPWARMVVLLAVVVVLLVALSIFAQHAIKSHSGGSGSRAPVATRPVSSLRL
jgi:hypothetical protein